MLISYYKLLLGDPSSFLKLITIICVSVLISITVHEFCHAFIARILGDRTAQHLRRLTLNPLRHLDPLGAGMLLIVGFGWGRPVPVNVRNLRVGKTGITLVALGGPISNVILASILAMLMRADVLSWISPYYLTPSALMSGGLKDTLSQFVSMTIHFNLLLALFNLLPIPPLDGSKMLEGLTPSKYYFMYQRLERYGPIALLCIIGLDITFNTGFLWRIIGQPLEFLTHMVVG
tara:strand:+ start:1816 stop:2514 length:699 start_codon:yes stop_codon:yes gene_type:complete